jgi:dienelactone hydrolase
MRALRLCCMVGVLGALLGAHAPAASADLASLTAACQPRDALDNDNTTRTLPFTFCDDGRPSAAGGTTPNLTAQSAIKVPSAYSGIAGLPGTDAAEAVPGEDPVDNTVALDVDLSLPDPSTLPATGDKYPVVVMMHGCCSGDKTSWEGSTIDPGGPENWHYDNAWFASRGYIVVNYTARGFVDANGHGSTGETQLDSGRYEINDYQSLAGQLADTGDLDPGPGVVKVDPQRIVPTGGSYGGGFTWMALTDPTWDSPAATPMRVVAAATKYGWTNLVESLVPRGDDLRDALPETDATKVKNLLKVEPGFPKRSINAALYASGKTGVPPGTAHTTFPAAIDQAQLCLTSTDPFESNPLCASTLQTELGRFIDERSAYFQNGFFSGLAAGTIDPVPVFSAGTFTDNLFPAAEHRRMVERLKATRPGYPVQEYYGDYNHFVQTKRKEFADVCGADHHVCTFADYPGGDLNADPPGRALAPGVTSRLNHFIDHYAKPPADPSEAQPAFDVTGALQVCPQNAAFVGAATDEPGPRFTAPTFAALAPGRLTINAPGTQPTTNKAGANPHGASSDPVGNLATNGGRCPVESSPGGLASAGAGVATYDSIALPIDVTMLGQTRVVVPHTGAGSGLQLNARLYDLYPDGRQVMVDRGVKRLNSPNGTTTLDLHGAGWRFAAGHRVRIELAQDDDTYIKSSVQPSAMSLAGATLSVPIREGSFTLAGGSAPTAGATLVAPRLASDQGVHARFRLRVRRAKATPAGLIDHYEVEARDTRTSKIRRLTSTLRGSLVRFRGKTGHTYRFRARAVDRKGLAGAWVPARTVVPLDDGKALHPKGAWTRPRSRRAFGGRFSRASRRGASLSVKVRGSRIYVIGRRSRRGGKARITINGRKRTVSFYGRRTRNRVVIASLRGRSKGTNRIRITVLGRKGAKRSRGRRVEVDALGALRD